MKKIVLSLSILVLAAVACQSEATPAPLTDPLTGSATEAVLSPSAIPFVLGTATPTSLPQGFIVVDSLEQEVYPFMENGKCSLGEAIFAANSGEAKDSCAAGVPGESVISLMPGEYHFNLPDQTPPQFEWLVSIVEIGNALPPVVFPVTIQGNGATLIRDEGTEPFRFFEVMVNGTLTLENMTLKNGDVLEDWGGAVYVSNGSLTLNSVRFVGNRAENGGAVYLTLGALTVQDSEFNENFASFRGGGINIDSAKAFVRNTQFVSNTADAGGGAMASESVTLIVEDSLFLKNITEGTRGGALHLEHVNATVTRSQFYQNQADWIGGAISVNNPVTTGASDEEGNPLDQVDESPIYIQMATLIPGYQSTLEAHPSGVFQDFYEDTQIHENCFANNIIVDPNELNFSSAIIGKLTNAEDNYFGNASGPSGGGPGTGDGVGRSVVFAPFLTEVPAYCDPELSQQVSENHNQ